MIMRVGMKDECTWRGMGGGKNVGVMAMSVGEDETEY